MIKTTNFRSLCIFVLTLAIVATLAGCSDDVRNRRAGSGSAATSAGTPPASTTDTPPAAVPADPMADVATAIAVAIAAPAPNISTTTAAATAPPFVWDFENSPTPYPSPTPDTNCSHIALCGWDVITSGGPGGGK